MYVSSYKGMCKFSSTIRKIWRYSNASVKNQNSIAYNFTSLLGAISEKYCSIFNSTYTRDHIYRCWPLVSINLSKPIFMLPRRSAGCLFSISVKVVRSIVLCMLLGNVSQQPLKPLFPLSEIDFCNMQILRKRKL